MGGWGVGGWTENINATQFCVLVLNSSYNVKQRILSNANVEADGGLDL